MKKTALVSLLLLAGGCSNTTLSTKTLNEETPVVAVSNMTPLLQCVANNVIEAYGSKGAYHSQSNPAGVKKMLVVIEEDQFGDGTVRKEAANDGPLADNNQAQMKAIINRLLPSHIVALPSREIPLLRRNSLKSSAITAFGTLDPTQYLALSQQYRADNIVYLSGSFNRLDNETPQVDAGHGTHIKEDGDLGVAFSTGKAKQESIVGLSTSIGHVGTNTELSSTLIEARMQKTSGEIKFSMVPGDTNVALSKKVILAEGVQGTQHMLLEAAALWFIGLAYAEEANLDGCMGTASDPAYLVNQQKDWGTLKEKEKITRIQQLLEQAEQLAAGGYQSGVLDAPTRKAIRAYEAAHGLFYTPHLQSNLDRLYLQLSARQ